MAENLAREYDLTDRSGQFGTQALKWVPDAVEAKLLHRMLKSMFGRIFTLERHRDGLSPLSGEAEKGLHAYVSGPLREQLVEERAKILKVHEKKAPPDVTLMFGHTHKPFQKEIIFQGYPQPVKVYNSGGWVVDAQPIHGGAIILVDGDFDTVSMRMYDDEQVETAVRVEQTLSPQQRNASLYQQVRDLIDPNKNANPCWQEFTEQVVKAVQIRRHNLWQKRGQGCDREAESETKK